ncbi:MAG: TIR domain-containing protein [Saprospiraceae bacterium]|nr:TIR domain-containing protein [Saprospiraceae bacterium]
MPSQHLIAAIQEKLGRELHLAPTRFDDDPVSSVMAISERQPLRYALREGRLAGLNLAYAGLTDAQWQAIRQLPGFDPARIEALNLRGNRLTADPTEGMTALRWLDLCENNLKEYVPPAGSLATLDHLWLYGNPKLSTPPPEIVARGRYALLEYFRSIARSEEGAAQRLFEAKMLVLGEGGAGKTSLARRLIDRMAPMPGEGESTRGIDILEYRFDTPAGEAFLLKIWDFAGQDIYHATHQFFLTRRSLYLLVDNTRYTSTEAPDNLFYYWFRVAELYGDNSPLLLVQNEIGDRSRDINYAGFAQAFPFIRGRYPVNIDTNRGLDALAEAISAQALQLPQVGEVWPAAWAKARQALEALAQQENYISYETFVQKVTEAGVNSEAEARVLSGFLHDLGVFLHFIDDERLGQLVVLRNQWATDAVYKVLDHEGVKKRFGQFTEHDLDAIWSEARYKFRKKELLALMERFELCYALPDAAEPTWLATQLLPEEAPAVPWDAHRNILVRYEFGFMPKGLIPRFIVRNNTYVGNIGRAWKYGVEMTSGATAAKITATPAINTIEVRVNNRGDYRAFLNTLTADLDRLLASFGERLVVEKKLPCPCAACAADPAPHFFAYSILRRRIEVLKKPTIECAKSGLDVEVQPFLDAFFGASEPAMKQVFISYSHRDEAAKDRLLVHLKLLVRQGKIGLWNDRLIRPGEEWDAEIKQALLESDIILLLLSPDALASDYIWDIEMKTALERHAKQTARVIPIILQDCEWKQTPLKGLQGLPRDGKPINNFDKPEDAWAAIAREIRELV